MTPPRTGIWLFPDAPARRFVDAVVAAEGAGLGEVWVGDEGPARDPFALLAAAATATSTVRLGIGVTNAYLRHPALTAASMATVDELSDGRAVLGLGPGGRLALAPVGLAPTRHLTDCRQALVVMRGVLEGRAVEGYEPPPHALTAPRLPIYVGARGERFNRWASAEADGVFLAGIAPSLLPDAVGWARSVRPIEVSLYVSACLDVDAVDLVRPRLVNAFADAPGALRRAAGLRDGDVRAAAAALVQGDPAPAAALLTDDVLGLVLAVGPDETNRRLVTLARALGPTSIGIAILGPDPLDHVERAAAVLATVTKELS